MSDKITTVQDCNNCPLNSGKGSHLYICALTGASSTIRTKVFDLCPLKTEKTIIQLAKTTQND